MIRVPHPSRALAGLCLQVALLVTVLAAPPAAAGRTQTPTTEDPALEQRITEDQPVGTGTAVLDRGHVDIGPAYVDGEWRLMVHDDAAEPPVWRHPADAVFRIGDDALVQVPDDPTYAFLGAPAGDSVHVVSQTQQPDVVWVGWNTQHPHVMDRIDRGVTLTMLGVDGPGQLSVYLQSGDFGPPEVLWTSADDEPQPIWVDVNTHTHANWVFSEPGVYLVRVEASAELRDGTTERSVADLRLAVGDATDPEDALAATGDALPDGSALRDPEVASSADEVISGTSGGGTSLPLVVAVVAGALLGCGVAVAVVRSRRTRAEAERRAPVHPS
jgi:putative ABC transporter-associated repeat protein